MKLRASSRDLLTSTRVRIALMYHTVARQQTYGTDTYMFMFVGIQHDQIILVVSIEVSFYIRRRTNDIYDLTSKHFWIFWVLYLIDYYDSV